MDGGAGCAGRASAPDAAGANQRLSAGGRKISQTRNNAVTLYDDDDRLTRQRVTGGATFTYDEVATRR
ncbi:hypothetical protein BH11ARM2_BH11ARM2_32370 [soil metagenome]